MGQLKKKNKKTKNCSIRPVVFRELVMTVHNTPKNKNIIKIKPSQSSRAEFQILLCSYNACYFSTQSETHYSMYFETPVSSTVSTFSFDKIQISSLNYTSKTCIRLCLVVYFWTPIRLRVKIFYFLIQFIRFFFWTKANEDIYTFSRFLFVC